jgi:hypothetical protein
MTSEYPLGAARITLQAYTHMLPGELEGARELFDKFLVNERETIPSPPSRSRGRSDPSANIHRGAKVALH